MRVFIGWCVLCVVGLWGHMVVNTTLTHTTQSSDLVLMFDTPYQGSIVKVKEAKIPSFVLTDTTLSETKELSDPRVEKVTLSNDPVSGSLLISISPFKEVTVTPAISKDRQTLRFRITESSLGIKSEELNATMGVDQPELGWRYGVAIAFMAVLLGVLWWVKQKTASKGTGEGGWLWGKKPSSFPFEILFSRGLDPKNRLLLFRLNGVKYLILTGVNNVLIDRFDDEVVVSTENDFDHILRQNEETLTKMLGASSVTPFERYRQNAES